MDGNSLGKTFNVFAAPEDLTNASGEKEECSYTETVQRLAELKGWNGFDGTNYETDKEFYEALKTDSYKGGWIMPPRELLTGTAADGPSGVRKGAAVQPDNLFDHQSKGALKRYLAMAAGTAQWYWSSTTDDGFTSSAWVSRFSDGLEKLFHKEILNSLPVRCHLVLR